MSGRNKSIGFAVLSIVFVLAAGIVVSGCGGGAAPKPAKVYKVTFEASGGEPVPEAQLVEAGSKIELPKAMARTKFTFSGWYKDLDCTEPWDFARDTVESDIILFANWKSAAGKSGGGGGGGSSGNNGPSSSGPPTPPNPPSSGTGATIYGRTITLGAGDAYFYAAAADSASNVYAVGLQGPGSYTYGTGVSTAGTTPNDNPVLVKYSPSGDAQWARSLEAGTTGSMGGFYAVAVDSSGNVYAAGFQDGAGSSYTYGTGVSVAGTASSNNPVLVKYSPSGNAQWARSLEAGGTGASFSAVAVDSAGNVYAVGLQSPGSYTYDVGVSVAGTASSNNPVLVKYSPSGAAQWARSLEADGTNVYFDAVAVDSSGNVYAAGIQYDSGPYTYGTGVSVAGAAPINPVLVKYSPSGAAQWARSLEADGTEARFDAVAVDSAGNVYAAGYQKGTGPYTYGTGVSVTGAAIYNPMLLKYDSGGVAQWVRSLEAGTTGTSALFNGLALSSGNAYAVGSQEGTDDYDYGSGQILTGSSTGYNPVLVKYN